MPTTLTVLRGGACLSPEGAVVPGKRWRYTEIPALFALLDHPTQGMILFDTGYHTRVDAATRRWPFRMFRYATPLRMGEDENVATQLAARDIAPEAIRWVILSHFDPDHIGGLRDFPQATVVASRLAWEAVAGLTGWAAAKAKLIPSLLPADLPERLHLVDRFEGPPLGPFPGSHDLFGDGELRLVELPGHRLGQVGLVLERPQDPSDQTVLLAADGCWSREALRRKGKGLHLRLAEDRVAQRTTYAMLKEAMDDHGWNVIPSHCPEATAEWLGRARTS